MRKLGNQLAIKDKGMGDRSQRALRGRQANLHTFFQLRTIWVVTAARKRRRVLRRGEGRHPQLFST